MPFRKWRVMKNRTTQWRHKTDLSHPHCIVSTGY